MRKFFIFCTLLFILSAVAFPLFASADGLVPCGTQVYSAGERVEIINGKSFDYVGIVKNPCTFNDFIVVVGNIVNLAIIFASVAAAVAFMWAGYIYLTSGGSQEANSRAKSIFKKVLIGYIIILSAWALVHMIEKELMANTNSPSNPTSPGSSFLGS
jgi:hypothetical protein